jgi:hypothetical protein
MRIQFTRKGKRFFATTLAATLAVAMAFTLNACSSSDDSDDDGDKSNYEMLNGVWDRGDIVVTFNGSNAVFTRVEPNSGWQRVLDNGSIRIGDKKFKNITGSNFEWTCEELSYDADLYIVSSWEDCTITMSTDGKTITAVTPGTNNLITTTTTYTKVQ